MQHLHARLSASRALHGTSSTAGKLIGVALLFVYGHVLPPQDFGVLALLYLTTTLVDAVVIQGLTARILGQQAADPQKRPVVITTAFVHTLCSASLLFGFLALAAGPMSVLLFHDPKWSTLLQLLCLAGVLRAAQHVPRQLLRTRGRHGWLDTLRLADALIAAALVGTLVLGAGLGLTGVVYGEVLRETFFALVLLPTLRRNMGRTTSSPVLRDLLRDGLPRLRRELPGLVLHANDRYFLAMSSTLAVVGTYGFALRLAQTLGDFVVQPLLGLVPALRHADGPDSPEDGRRIRGRFCTYFVALAGLAALAIAVFASPLLRLLCLPQYEGATWLMPLLLMALLLAGVQKLLLLMLRIEHQLPDGLHRATAAAAGLSIVSNAILVPRFGPLGTALSAVLAQALLCATALVAARRAALVHWEAGRLVKGIAALLCTLYIGGFVMPENLVGQIAAAWAMVLLYPALLGVLGFYTVAEIEKMRDLFNHRVAFVPARPAAAPEPGTIPAVYAGGSAPTPTAGGGGAATATATHDHATPAADETGAPALRT